MKAIREILIAGILFIGLILVLPADTMGQCAMCSLNAENSTQHGNTQGKGLNDGVLFLLGAPFLIGGAIAILWYKKYRTKSEKPPIFLHQS